MRIATATPTATPGIGIVGLLYLVAGGILAANHHYWTNVDAVKPIVSALLATLLWPLLLVGIDLRVH